MRFCNCFFTLGNRKSFLPTLASHNEGREILQFISKVSKPINNKEMSEPRWFEEISEEYLSGNIKSWVLG